MAAGLETEIDLYRCAAHLRAPSDPSRAHDLCAGCDHHRAAVVKRAEPAEHPGAHRRRPKDPPRLHRLPRPQAGVGGLFANRIAAIGGDRRHSRFEASLPRRARHSRHDRVGNVRRPDQGHAGRGAAPRESDQFRHHLRHLGVWPGQPARHRQRGSFRLHQEVFRAFSGHPRLYGRDARFLPHPWLCQNAVRQEVPLSRYQGFQRLGAILQRARRDQCTIAGHRRRHHPPRHDPHGRRAGGEKTLGPDAVAGARRTDL